MESKVILQVNMDCDVLLLVACFCGIDCERIPHKCTVRVMGD